MIQKTIFAIVFMAVLLAPLTMTIWANPPTAAEQQRATVLAMGRAASGNLGRGESHWFRLELNTRTSVAIIIDRNTDTVLELYDSGGTLIARSGVGVQSVTARLDVIIERGITYFIKVSGINATIRGRYDITVRQDNTAQRQFEAEQRRAEEERRRIEEERRRIEAERAAATAAANAAAGFIDLWSAFAGTVLINGEASTFTVQANGTVRVRVENAAGREFTIAVQDGRTVHQAREATTIRITGINDSNRAMRNAGREIQPGQPNMVYNAVVLDPNPPPNPESDFQVQQNANNTITITGYTGTRRQLVIPETISGGRVTHIGSSNARHNVFNGRNLVSVVIPNSVTHIGVSAFANNQITVLTLPTSLRTIQSGAFMNNQIQSLTIPNGVTLLCTTSFVIRSFPTTSHWTVTPWPLHDQYRWPSPFAGNPLSTLVIPASLARTTRVQALEFTHPGNARLNPIIVTVGIDDEVFRGLPITRLTLPANMDDGTIWSNFPEALLNFWRSQNRAAGTYVLNGSIWTRE